MQYNYCKYLEWAFRLFTFFRDKFIKVGHNQLILDY